MEGKHSKFIIALFSDELRIERRREMSLDWNRNGHIDAADYMITEMLNQELERKKKKQEITKANNERDEDENEFLE